MFRVSARLFFAATLWSIGSVTAKAEEFHIEGNTVLCRSLDQLKEYARAAKSHDTTWAFNVGCGGTYADEERKVAIVEEFGNQFVKVRVFGENELMSTIAYTARPFILPGPPKIDWVDPATLPYDSLSKLGTGKLKVCVDKLIRDDGLVTTLKVPAGTVFRDRGVVDNDEVDWWNLSIVTTKPAKIKRGTRCTEVAAQVIVDESHVAKTAAKGLPAVHAFKKDANRQLIPWDYLKGPPWVYGVSESVPPPDDLPDLVGLPATDFR